MTTPSDKTELKPQMSPQCPFCESLGVGYKTIANKHGDQRIQAVCLSCDARGPSCDNESLSYELFDIRSELSKPSETPMSKEEPIEYKKEYNAFCPACGTYGHTSGDCQKIQKGLSSPNPLPSSPSTDKCREEHAKWLKPIHTISDREEEFALDAWQAAWQASRKECEKQSPRTATEVRMGEDIDKLESRIRELQVENEQLKEKLRIKEECYHESFNRNVFATIEISRLKQELCEYEPMEKWSKLCEEWADKCASLQSVVEAKDEALKSLANEAKGFLSLAKECGCCGVTNENVLERKITAALQIDQAGEKSEYKCNLCGHTVNEINHSCTGVFPVPSATPVSSHEWISVKDRLPGDKYQVLVFCNTKEMRFASFVLIHNRWSIWDYGDYDDVHDEKPIITEVTHWMPLPESPKSKEENK